MGETVVGRGIATKVVGNMQVVTPVVVVVDLVVVRLRVMGRWVVVGVGVVRLRMVVGAVVERLRVVDCQRRRGWSIVDDMVNRRKNMGLVVPVTSEAMTCWAKADWPRGSWTKTFWA